MLKTVFRIWNSLGHQGCWLMAGCVSLCATTIHASQPSDYDQQPAALLSQMTLDEKIGQMTQTDSDALQKNKADVENYFLGSILSGGGHDPAQNNAEGWAASCMEYRSWALKTRLKIPLLYGIDAVHGHNNVDGAVIFPHNIGLGATRDPALVEKAGRVVEEEVAGTGIQWAFAPCVAVAQDESWGRTYESFGQSADLVTELGAAEIRGLQGPKLSSTPVLACAKHFLADGGTANGIDQGNTICDEATLRKVYLAPYVAAIKAGVGSIMVSYSSWNGKKMHGNKYLLTDVLKGELGFKGFLVSDWAAIDQLSPDYKSDVAASINAGVDMVMVPNGPNQSNNYIDFIRDLKELVAEGQVPMSRIDDAVTRILRIKYQMGLFDQTDVDPALTAAVGSAEHREVARECVRESLVLLKNANHALPLDKHIKHLHVMGRAADDMGMQCGGWTISWQGEAGQKVHGGTTILSAIRATVSPETEVTYSATNGNRDADAVLVVVGEMPYAETKGDRKDMRLSQANMALIAKARETGVPVITMLISGRPLVLDAALEMSDAVVAAWLPGTEGQGVADVLFGDYKPTGKLPREWPLDNSQLSTSGISGTHQPLFPYGYGLTYDSQSARPATASTMTPSPAINE